MKFTYNWLKDYVDTRLAPDELARKLTMAGLEVNSVERIGDDFVFEAEITSNRPDWLSVIGIAREAAAITGAKLKRLLVHRCTSAPATSRSNELKISIADKNDCAMYIGRLIKNVKVAPSPEWMRKRLEAVGIRPINNIVDITNYCLLEYGQPLHAFDYDKLKGAEITVRRAKADEEITTIDETRRKLGHNILVIADNTRPVAVAGIMGGLDTEINNSTKNVLLESAYFTPILVRRTSKKLGVSSDSSYRFERNVDIEGVDAASERATQLIAEFAGGAETAKFCAGKKPKENRKITLNFEKLNKILGVAIEKALVKKIITALGFKIIKQDKNKITVAPLSFRKDVSQEIDLIEEISRVYGYDKIPATMPRAFIKDNINPISDEKIRPLSKMARDILCAAGFDEIMTYSLLSRVMLRKAGFDDKQAVMIKNPLSAEQEAMRPSLLPELLSSMSTNISKRNTDAKLFELGRVYSQEGDENFIERLKLSIGITGKLDSSWRRRPEDADMLDLKGAIIQLFRNLGVENCSFADTESPCMDIAAEIFADGVSCGLLGRVKKSVSGDFDIKQDVFAAELDIEHLFGKAHIIRKFKALARYPSSSRDIAMIVKDGIKHESIDSLIRKSGGEFVSGIKLFDLYRGGQIPKGNVSLAYTVEFRHPDRTLRDDEVNGFASRIKEALVSELSARIR